LSFLLLQSLAEIVTPATTSRAWPPAGHGQGVSTVEQVSGRGGGSILEGENHRRPQLPEKGLLSHRHYTAIPETVKRRLALPEDQVTR